MRSRSIPCIVFLLAAAAFGLSAEAAPAIPTHFSYQGLLVVDGAPYSGAARFMFALVDTTDGTLHWTNDGQDPPEDTVDLLVEQGVFSVLLGASPMNPIDPDRMAAFTRGQALRVWVNTGDGMVQLGDQPLSSVLFADRSVYAEKSSGWFTAENTIWSRSGGFRFPDGTVQATAATGGGGGAGTLDEAYDGGGSGAGRFIYADAGCVDVTGPAGLHVSGGGPLGVGVSTALAPLHLAGGNWDLGGGYGDLMIGNATHRFGIGLATDGGGAGDVRLRSVGGTGRTILGGGANDVLWIDADGIEITRGTFRIAADGQVSQVGDFGAGQANAAIRAENTNASGIALWAETAGNDAVLVAKQSGTGDLIRGFQGDLVRFQVQDDGHTVVPSLSVAAGAWQIAADGQVTQVGDFGAGQYNAAVRAQNTNASGIALWAETAGNDAVLVAKQTGSGDIMRGFQGVDLKFRVRENGQVVTPSVQVTGGADFAEPFDVGEDLDAVLPGSVLVIDPRNPGRLALSREAYDRRVAGIVSGAGGVNPGLTLSQPGLSEDGLHVALSGRVYVRASVENGAIVPGDMITTSSRPGMAMRATDRDRAFGAVVGKAMTGLEGDDGLVLVLVGLQ